MTIKDTHRIRLRKDLVNFMGLYLSGAVKSVYPINFHYTLAIINKIKRK